MPDSLTIHNGKVLLTTEEGRKIERPESQFVDMLGRQFLPPLNDTALPDGVKFVEWRDPFLLIVHQLPPHVRQLRWIDDKSPRKYGPGTKYRKVRLSIPYAITFALFFHNNGRLGLMANNELYFRNEPLRVKADHLCFPALLNISRINTSKRQRSWICTQYLQQQPDTTWTDQLSALLDHTWNGGFNLSSEHHEGASWYSESKGVHADLHPVEKWQRASAANDAFALSVPWKPAPLSVGALMECLLEENQQAMTGTIARQARGKPAINLVGRFLNYLQQV